MPSLHPRIYFGIVSIVGRGIFFCFDLAKVFLQAATQHPRIFFLDLSFVWEKE